MNTEIIQLINAAAKEGVSLFIGDNRLQYKVIKGVKPNANLIDDIRNHKEQIFRLLKNQQEHEKGMLSGEISKLDRTVTKEIPLSFSQERLHFIDQMGGSQEYHIHAISKFTKDLNTNVLQDAFREIMQRHEILRTIIKIENGNAFQEIQSEVAWNLEHIIATENTTETITQQFISKPFALDKDYMLRAVVIDTVEEYTLVIVLHHIATDGWSMSILNKELFQSYQAKLSNQPSNLPQLAIQYADYAVWQREQLQGEVLEGKLNFWKKYLENSVALELPLDYNRPAIKEIEGRSISFLITNETTKELNKIVASEQITLFSLLLASLKVLLYKYTGQEDICIGTPVANRGHKSLEKLIGFFVNTVVLRSQIPAKSSFIEFTKNVNTELLEVYKHQDTPFEKVVDSISKERSQSRSLLFDVLFAFQNQTAPAEIEISVDQYDEFVFNDTFAQFDLTFNIKETASGLVVSIEYLKSLFKQETIERMCNHFKQILTTIADNAQQEVQQIDIVTQQEKHKLLYEFNEVDVAYPKEKTIVDLFEAQVAKTPNNIALVFKNTQLTYAEVNAKSNQLAEYLRNEFNIQSDDLVGVLLERSEWMVITLLAVLKSGGAYVPIDPNYPADRVAYMTKDSNCKVVLDQNELEKFMAVAENYTVKNLAKQNTPQNLAYVIYTSGTTGNPKGTLIEHENVVRLFKNEKELFNFDEKDVWILFHSYCFDFSVWEMYGALLFGGKLVVAPFETAKDTNLFIDLLVKEKVTVLNQTPSSFYNLIWIETEKQSKNLYLRYVIFGGEALSPGNLKNWNLRYPNVKLINMYGITETTVHVTYKEITQKEINQNISNIGTAIPTLTSYVFDQEKNLVPIGIIGELYVGGAGVARGYLNRPELTSQRFIQNPFKPAEKLYRSGDKVRLLHNGEMEYLGRIDNQVKIRGYRIELGEIENAIKEYSTIKSVALLVKTLEQGHAVLIAFVVSDETIDLDQLKVYLKEKLPNYMVPGIFLQIEKLPVNHNGKLDRNILLELVDVSKEDYIAPRNETEERLIHIWKELLHLAQISVEDDFFLIGGDSIILIRLISQIKKEFQREVKLSQVYEYPTVANLAKFIDKAEEDQANRIAIREKITSKIAMIKADFMSQTGTSENIEDVYPMSDIQIGMVFEYYKGNVGNIYHDQMLYTIPVVDFEIFKQAIQLLTIKHETLRTTFNITDFEYGLQVVHKTISTAHLGYEDCTALTTAAQEEHIGAYLQAEKNNKFIIDQAPLWRAKIFKINHDTMVYVFQCHHAIIDGWSLASLNAELSSICEKLSSGIAIELQPLQMTNKKAIVASLIGKENKENHTFWKNYLNGFERLDLFTEEKMYVVVEERFTNYTYAQVKKVTQELGITLRTLFLGAYLYALNTIQYGTDITIGLVTNNRPAQEDGDKVIGCFLNTIPFRMQLENNEWSWKEFLQNVHQNLDALNATDRLSIQDISTIVGHKDITNNSFFDIIFNFVNFHVYNDMVVAKAEAKKEKNTSEAPKMNLKSFENTNSFFDFSMSVTGEELNGSFKLKRNLKSATTLTNFVAYFNHIFHKIIHTPEALVKDTNILTVKNKIAELESFNATKKEDIATETVVDLFEVQVLKTPNSIAIEFENTSLTYHELNKRANQLAHHLKTQGIQQETLVGICMDRSLEMMIGLMGILKAGGAYVPIDPSYPMDRINYILDDTKTPVVLTTQEHVTKLRIANHTTVVVDATAEVTINTHNPEVSLTPENLMYVIYTSGSTGKPKGVMNQHDAVINSLQYGKSCYNLTEKDVVLQKTTYSFDVSVWELFIPLITGVKLVFAKPEGHKDNRYLKKIINSKLITTIHFVPSMLAMFLSELEKGDCPSLKQVICSGEALKPHHIQQFKECFTNTKLYNLYGPTEAAIHATFCDIVLEGEVPEKVSIGKPVANTNIYILDKFLNQQAVGIVGELCIGGIQVARGYLNQPELTAEKFMVNPHDETQRLYRTGDLARWTTDGFIEFSGRKDTQVKVRGLRIELGEIEHAIINAQENLQQAVVCVNEVNNQEVIVAYVVSNDKINKQTLRTTIAAKLPDYMVPSYFVQVETIPLTPNGKIDYKKLPTVGSEDVIKNEYIAPTTEIEKIVVEICESILQVNQIGKYDSFFELGGNSLNAIQLSTKLSARGYQLDIVQVLKTPKLAELATHITKKTSSNAYKTIISDDDYTVSIPLSEQQKQYFGANNSYRHAIGSFVIILENFDTNQFEKVVHQLYTEFPSVRMQFKLNEDGELCQLPIDAKQFSPTIIVDTFGNLAQEQAKVAEKLEAERKLPLAIDKGEVMKIHVCKDANHAAIQFTMHHAVTDDYSNQLLKKYIENAYTNLQASSKTLKEGYQTYQKLQKAFIESTAFAEKLSFLKAQLNTTISKISKPFTPKSEAQHITVASYYISGNTYNAINLFVQQQQLSMGVFIQAVAYIDQYLSSRKTAFIFNNTLNGRDVQLFEYNLGDAIGQFSSVIPLGIQLDENETILANIQNIQEIYIAGRKHQEVPYRHIEKAIGKSLDMYTIGIVNSNETTLFLDETLSNTTTTEFRTQQFPIDIKSTLYTNGIHIQYSKVDSIVQSNYNPETFESLLQSILQTPQKRLNTLQTKKVINSIE
ncbi:amino acid adenylation domain-containing protein [Kordia sp.]|uniref:amino acid adenylation domain-containing protein n=1 Tax=Kordia sp. TaxID=1965332 RepID=UPI003D288CB2